MMKDLKISVQNEFLKSTDCQMIVSVDGSEMWKSSCYRWKLPQSEHAVRVNGGGKGSYSFKNIQFLSHPSNCSKK